MRAVAAAALLAVFAGAPAIAGAEAAELDWVALEGACFVMGEDEAYREERPAHETCVAPFAITRTEITNAQFSAFVAATGYRTRAERGWRADEAGGPGVEAPPGSAVFDPPTDRAPRALNWWRFEENANWRTPSGAGNEAGAPHAPVVHVTPEDARAFADWAGGRLPSEAEWEYAARGGLDGQLLAWGDAHDSAVTDRANTWQGVFPVLDLAEDGHGGIAPVARYPANGFGLHDMIGNVWEWTASAYAPSHAERDRALAGPNGLDPAQPGAAVAVIKGGSYLCARSYCFRFRPAARQAQDLAIGASHIGFRLVRDAQPGRTGGAGAPPAS